MKKQRKTTTTESMEETDQDHQEVADATIFTDSSDLCQQLLDRYGKSSAPQHRHLCATAAATRAILQSESLPLTSLSYFAATISNIADSSKILDSNAITALSAFLAILLPLLPEKSIAPAKAADAVYVLVDMVERPSEAVSTASLRAMVKCLGVLLGFCDLEDWESVKLGFETLLKFSIDKRPKVRRCAQDCLVKFLNSLKSSAVIKEASKLVFCLLKRYMPLAVKISASDGHIDETLSKPEHLEVLHMLNVVKLIIPYLSLKVSSKVLLQLHKLMSSQFSALTRHVFSSLEAILERTDNISREVEKTIVYLTLYVSFRKKNPMDTLISAATLLKSAVNKLCVGEASKWIDNLPLVFGSIAGLLTHEASTASHASVILKELINCHVGRRDCLIVHDLPDDSEVNYSMESSALKSICGIFDRMLSTNGGIPNEYILAVISVLFLKIGEISYFYMKSIIHRLAEFMVLACNNKFDTVHLQECIGSAVIAIGPEKILSLLPVSVNAEDLTCSNIWLIPILKNFVVGSSLGFYMEHIVPLAQSIQQSCHKEKKSVTGDAMQAHALSCIQLLPAFCRYPTDTYQNFEPLADLLITFLKDSFMLETIAIALQQLVSQNREILGSNQSAGEFAKLPKTCEVKESSIQFDRKPSYTKKIASRNIRALTSCSKELLQALTDVFFNSAPAKRAFLKDAIGCLASISDPSITKTIFISSLERFQLMNDLGECEKLGSYSNALLDKEGSTTSANKDAGRCLIMELASCFSEGANEDLVGVIFNCIKNVLQESDELGQHEAYHSLSILLEKHSWFCSSQFTELMDLLLCLKSSVEITSLKSRFACFQILLVHTIKRSSDEENTKAFLILNEIILKIKDSNEEVRKAAYDMLLRVNSNLQNSSATEDGPQSKLIGMIMGYLSSSSPQIKSGAVSALSVLLYNDTDVLLIPDLVPSVLALLQTKALEVIKAVLGFAKVLVSCLKSEELENFLSDTLNGILPWSSVSRHHFRLKVTVILEIMIRKCGLDAVELITPEKYRDFVKGFTKSHHGKTNFRDSSTTAAEPNVPEPSAKRLQKRKRNEQDISTEENGSMETRKRNWTRNRDNTPTSNEPRKSAGFGNGVERMKKGRHLDHASAGHTNKKGNINRHPWGSGNRKIERTKMSKNNGAAAVKSSAASKFPIHKKVKKQQKIG